MRQPEGENLNQCEDTGCYNYAPFNVTKGRQRRYCRKHEAKHTERLKRKGFMQNEIDDRLLA